jgi:glycosyltransferase involved in cell wall biosynthesis
LTLLLLDPNLTSEQGHHLAYDLRIAREAVRRGQATTIMANRAFAGGVVDGVRILPFFTETCYGAGAAELDPIAGRFDEFRHLNDVLAEDLARLPRADLTAADCVLVPTVSENHLLGYVTWMRSFGALDAPLFVVHLMLPSGLVVADAADPGAVVDAQRALYYRLAFRAAREPGGPAIRFFASGRQHAAEFTRLAGYEVPPHPVPIAPAPGPATVEGPRRRLLLFAGDAKLEKGLALLPELARRLCAAHPDWTFVVHANPEIAWGPAREALQEIARIAARLANLELGLGRLEEAQYQALLEGVDAMLFTYDPAHYGRKSSGVLWEAISLGRPVIVPADTWLEAEARAWGAGYVPYAPYGAAGAAAAFAAALPRLSGLALASAEGGARWRAENGAGALFDQLSRLWAARLLAAGLAARPREVALDLAGIRTPGWHAVERAGDATVRWTGREAVLRFDWPHRAAWELEIAVRGHFGIEQLEGLTARIGSPVTSAAAHPAPLAVSVGHGDGDGTATVTIAGPAAADTGGTASAAVGPVEVTLGLPFTRRPPGERRDLGILVGGLRLRPARGARGALAPAQRTSLAGHAPAAAAWARGTPLDDGSFVVGPVLSGDLSADPDHPAWLSLRLHCPDGPAAARRLALWVNGMPVRLELNPGPPGGDATAWEGLARIPAAVLRRGGAVSAWDLCDTRPEPESLAGRAVRLLAVEARAAADAALPAWPPADAVASAPHGTPPSAATRDGDGVGKAPAGADAAALPEAVQDAAARGLGSSAAGGCDGAAPAAADPGDGPSDPAAPTPSPLRLRWDLSRGFGPLEGPFPELGLSDRVRWITARAAGLVIEAREAGTATLRLRYRSPIPGQSAEVLVNATPGAPLRFDGSGRLDQTGEAALPLDLCAGPNVVALAFAEAVREPGSERELVLLLERVELD